MGTNLIRPRVTKDLQRKKNDIFFSRFHSVSPPCAGLRPRCLRPPARRRPRRWVKLSGRERSPPNTEHYLNPEETQYKKNYYFFGALEYINRRKALRRRARKEIQHLAFRGLFDTSLHVDANWKCSTASIFLQSAGLSTALISLILTYLLFASILHSTGIKRLFTLFWFQ